MLSMRLRNGLRIKDLVAELSTRFREISSLFIPSQSVTFAELETSGTLQPKKMNHILSVRACTWLNVRFVQKATEVLRRRELTQRAISRHHANFGCGCRPTIRSLRRRLRAGSQTRPTSTICLL